MREEIAQAQRLTQAASRALELYLDCHERLFSWKNALGWNRFEGLKEALPDLAQHLGELLDQANDQLSTAQTRDPLDPLLVEYFNLLTKYLDFLKQAVQTMTKLLIHLESKKTGKFKQAGYELDLAVYKQKVDRYQLYGQELTKLIAQLSA